ncbi:MAG: NYN domain-containing protein, partial [Chloroflexi bacterium]|nr:NYN domain-containing protein [Chloroflexota bacterium]
MPWRRASSRSASVPRPTRVARPSRRRSRTTQPSVPAGSVESSPNRAPTCGGRLHRPAADAEGGARRRSAPTPPDIGDRVGKNVAVFVDVANIFYAAKAAGVDIDYVTLLKASSAGRDLVRAYAYTGLDPENENQRNFHDFLRRHGYRVVSKDIRKYGDGKVKANLDIELVVDMMKTARNLDVAIVVSGDGDFAPAIRAVQEMGVRVEVVSFRGNTSSDLMDVADQFTDITQVAKVEKGSSRSGRRVAGDEADLSMTEVPDKQSEGATERGRGRGRSRRVAEPAAAPGRGRSRRATGGEPALVVLPGEKLSRAAGTADEEIPAEATLEDELGPETEAAEGAAEGQSGDGQVADENGRRRRRRRGGRGRGRGRGREEGYPEGAVAADGGSDEAAGEEEEPDVMPARPRPTSTFGSVWDSQIGIPTSARSSASPISDDEDLDEPEIPEYLLAERRRRESGRGRGGRGARGGRGSAYAAALERERYGGGRGGMVSRYAEPPRGREPARDRREPVPQRGGGRPAPRRSGDEPWSEVPPEIEAMLRAQLGPSAPRRGTAPATEPPPAAEAEAEAATPARPTRRATAGRRGRTAPATETAESA